MTTKNRLTEAQKELQQVKDKVEFFKSLLYLEQIWETADYRAWGYDENLDLVRKYVKLFGSVNIDYYAKNDNLVKEIKRSAKHFKDMCDEWPHWKQEAYKNAKIFQNLYNKYMKDSWTAPWSW